MTNKLELLLRRAGRLLRDYQVATIRKIPEEFQRTDADFYGYTVSGRCILIEAKMVNRPRLPIGSSPGLAGHQWEALCEANRANVLALICWQRSATVATISVDMAIKLSEGSRSIPWTGIPDQFKHPATTAALPELLTPFLCLPTSAQHVDHTEAGDSNSGEGKTDPGIPGPLP